MVIVWMWGEIGGQNAMALAFKCLLCFTVCLCVCVCTEKLGHVCAVLWQQELWSDQWGFMRTRRCSKTS